MHEKHNGNELVIEFLSVIRGGSEGLMAILVMGGEQKYYELAGLKSLLKKYRLPQQQLAVQAAIQAITSNVDLEDVPEFESNLPIQKSLFM